MADEFDRPVTSRRIFVRDINTNKRFLIDTGSDLCVYPRSGLPQQAQKESGYELVAANGTPIATYGIINLTLNLSLRRDFNWRFLVADVSHPIIGVDFLAHYNLVIDARKQQLCDATTQLTVTGQVAECEQLAVKTLTDGSTHFDLLARYPEITRPDGAFKSVKHNTKHYLNVTPGPPVAQRPRRLPPDRLQAAKKEFDAMLKLGIARPSKSPWASPLHMVPKGGEEWRPCGDYRALNSRTEPDSYPVRHIQDFAQQLSGKSVFSTIDLVRAFNQIPVAEADIPKTAITTPFGLYEFMFMTFGLRNAAQTFQRFMDEVLCELDFVYCYIDDILIASSDLSEHYRHLDIVFNRLKQYGIVINPSKCVFGQSVVKFLGYQVSAEGTRPLPEKVEAIRAFQLPETAKKLRQFLGMLNFYRRFIPRAASKQSSLNDLLHGKLKGKSPIEWTPEAIEAFNICKESLAEAALLAHPKPEGQLAIFSDASDHTIGAALQQKVNDDWQPIAFFSKKLTSCEQKYSAYDRELYAIYSAIKHFRHYVEARQFTVYTDHKPITYCFSKRSDQLTPRQYRYQYYISQFTSDLRYIKGDDNTTADLLSRVDAINSPRLNWQEISKAQTADGTMATLRADSGLQLKQIQMEGASELVYCDISTSVARPYIPESFRRAAYDTVHEHSHPGANATVKLATQRFVWPSIRADCRRWARSCIPCQKSKITRHVTTTPGTFTLPSARFEHVHIDIVVMPSSEGYNYCLTCVDRFTRWPEVIPIENQEAETVARAFYANWIARFGTPLRVTTDQGRQFESHLFKHLNSLTGTTHIRTCAYHPSANGLVERLHRQLKAAIKCHDTAQWTRVLPSVLMGIRASWKDDLRATPAEMLYGDTIRLPGEFLQASDKTQGDAIGYVKELREHFRELRPIPGTRHGERRTFVFKELATASHVFIRHDASKRMLQQPYDGPYEVIARNDKTFIVNVRGREVTVSIERLKPAYIIAEDVGLPTEDDGTTILVHPRAITPVPTPVPGLTPRTTAPNPEQPQGAAHGASDGYRTKAGRRVRFPDYLQAGFP